MTKLNKCHYSFDEYKKRKISFLKIISKKGWDIKAYGIQLSVFPNDNIEKFILGVLPYPALTENRYGTGFLIVHQGTVTNWIMLNWWGFEDIVHQKLYTSRHEDFSEIGPVEDTSIIACVHELDVYNFESYAWKKHILSAKKPDFEAYLHELFHDKG